MNNATDGVHRRRRFCSSWFSDATALRLGREKNGLVRRFGIYAVYLLGQLVGLGMR